MLLVELEMVIAIVGLRNAGAIDRLGRLQKLKGREQCNSGPTLTFER